ncbi:MAG: carboxypeptidase regulatory-like domain-containing protein [Terriglobia bacterium]
MKDDLARDKAMDKLVAKQLRARLKPGSRSCPDAEILAAFVERTLAPRERAGCEIHLASCLGCQALVAELVRLSEDDGPAEVQSAAESSVRAPAAPRFHWAWAGSVLAAILVGGLWYAGEFRNVLQQTPETTVQIRSSQPNKPASPATTGYDNKVTSPPASESRRDQENKSNGNKIVDQLRPPASIAVKTVGPRGSPSAVGGLGGTSAHRVASAQTQNEVTASTPQPAPPAPAADRFEPSKNGAIATPSQRAALAKEGAGVARGVGLGNGQVVGPNKAKKAGAAVGVTNHAADNLIEERGSVPSLPQPTGTLRGQVVDPSGAVIPGATVTATNRDTALSQTTATTSAGNYVFPGLLPGKYTVSVERPGFKGSSLSDVAVVANQMNEADLRLELGQTTQSVEVTAAVTSLEVQAQSAAVQAEPATPQWRVGRRGLIQKRDANGKWKKQESGVKAHINDIAFSNPDDGWAVGQDGTILRTTDGGATWTKLPKPTGEDLVHVKATSNQQASVVTRGGQTFETTNGGKTWRSKQ